MTKGGAGTEEAGAGKEEGAQEQEGGDDEGGVGKRRWAWHSSREAGAFELDVETEEWLERIRQ